MTEVYQVGQTVRLSTNIQVNGSDADPGALIFTIRAGRNGTVTTYTYGTDAALVKDNTGDYHVDWLVVEEATHYYRFSNASTGAARGAKESEFRVEDSAFT